MFFPYYAMLGQMSVEELRELQRALKFHPDPWAVGARKLVAAEITYRHGTGNKIIPF